MNKSTTFLLTVLTFVTAAAVARAAPEKGSRAETARRTWSFTPDPNLPNVLILGDSISIGYTLEVRALLKGKANVFRPLTADGKSAENCSGTTKGVQALDRWLGDRKWAVIHFNWGLHDLKHVARPGADQATSNPQDPLQATVEQYAQNLTTIVKRLKATHARLVFATTTPVAPGTNKPLRSPNDPPRYNAAAVKIMNANGIRVNDLFTLCQPRLDKLQLPANVHFTAAGSRALAEQTAKIIGEELRDAAAGK
jgi:lysophospholipase L1-like esterase